MFAGQKYPLIIFSSKEIYIYSNQNNKIPIHFVEIKKKFMVFGKFHASGHSYNVVLFMYGAIEGKNMISQDWKNNVYGHDAASKMAKFTTEV